MANYRAEYQQGILHLKSVVLVAEDKYEEDEVNSVYDALENIYPPLDNQVPPEVICSGKIIVAVASLSLRPGSSRKGQFLPEGVNALHIHYQSLI